VVIVDTIEFLRTIGAHSHIHLGQLFEYFGEVAQLGMLSQIQKSNRPIEAVAIAAYVSELGIVHAHACQPPLNFLFRCAFNQVRYRL
jgi:hypothetical protein